MTEANKQDAYRWEGRPLRNLTDTEVESALQERKTALAGASNQIAAGMIQIAIDRLERENGGRQARRQFSQRFEGK